MAGHFRAPGCASAAVGYRGVDAADAGRTAAGGRDGAARPGRAAPARRVLARRELPLGRADLPARQPAAARAAAARARQAAAARPLRHDARPEPRLRAPEPRDPRARPRRDLRHRPRPRRPGARRERVPRGHVQRGLPARSARDEDGLRALFRQFSFPGGIPSHVAPETPGSIHEGGELGYALAHAFGAAFDNPDLLVACVVGDGEAETGPLATSWHANKFLNPRTRRRRAADPAPERLQDREPDRARAHPRATSCVALLEGYGWRPIVVAGDEPGAVHQRARRRARRGARRDRARSSARRATAADRARPRGR